MKKISINIAIVTLIAALIAQIGSLYFLCKGDWNRAIFLATITTMCFSSIAAFKGAK